MPCRSFISLHGDLLGLGSFEVESLLDEFRDVRGWGLIGGKRGQCVAQGDGDDGFGWADSFSYGAQL